MKRLLLLSLALSAPAGAASQLALEADYRLDEFEWSIAGPGGTPNVLSELSWTDLRIAQLGLRGQTDLGALVLRAVGHYGEAYAGSVRDSDFLGDDRTGEFLRSVDSADGSRFTDVQLAAGLPLPLLQQGWRVALTPLLGVAYHRQELRIRGAQGLDSRYRAEWLGPWAGLELAARHPRGFGATLRAAYHFQTDYDAEAAWNLRQDFAQPVSFVHAADGEGATLALIGSYTPPASPWSIALRASWQRWRTDAGTDTLFFADGGSTVSRFNGAEWQSLAVSVGGRYRF
jgi:hypothetical protein